MKKLGKPLPRSRENGRFVRFVGGHVKRYFPDIGMGTVIDCNGLAYSFERSDWLSDTQEPQRGQPVTFQLDGNRAIKIQTKGEDARSVENSATP